MSEDNVIQFPFGRINNPLADPEYDHCMYVSKLALTEVIEVLGEHGFAINMDNPYDDPLFNDLGIVLNIVYAAMKRKDGEDHLLLEVMDEISLYLQELKSKT